VSADLRRQISEATPDLLYWFEERAGIHQYDGRMERAEAEKQAYAEMMKGGGQ
jgi:hypothetical protein